MDKQPARIAIVAAFLAVYLIWGSTYLAIRFTLESLPPLLTAGVRFLVAGSLMLAWARLRGGTPATAAQVRAALVVGSLVLLVGHGGVVWAERWVPSGLAAVFMATVPLWFAALDRGNRAPLGPLLLGFAGIVLLVGPSVLGHGSIHLGGALLVLLGAGAWAAGSVYSRSLDLHPDPVTSAGLQMFSGGALLAVAGLLAGEGQTLPHLSPTLPSLAALGYLVVFGSLVGFSAYSWLLRHVSTRLVGTYAYVNPVVAVLLGSLAGERLSVATLAAVGLVLASVVLLLARREGSEPVAAKPSRPWWRPGRWWLHRPAA